MHCASCAAIITRTLKKVPGVEMVSVNYGTETASISFDSGVVEAATLSETIRPLGYSLEIEKNTKRETDEKTAAVLDLRFKTLSIFPLAVLSALIMGWDTLAEFGVVAVMPSVLKVFFHHLLPIIATYTMCVAGMPYILGVYRFFRYGKANMDTLIGIGTLAAFLYSFVLGAFENVLRPFLNVEYTYYDVTIVVIAFITFGKYLEAKSKLRTGDAIKKLLNLQAKTALIWRAGHEIELPIEEVVKGDVIVVKPGSKIPVDGVVATGSSYVDESMISGEPVPVLKETGAAVVAGTLNTSGSFTFTATKIGSETMLANIIKMVGEAQGSKAPIQALADKISAVFVPIVLVIATLALAAWLTIGAQFLGTTQAISYGLVSFVGVLVIACPCALGLATPTAIIVGVGKGASLGILIKDAATLQKLRTVQTIILDKTGTITKGKPELTSIQATAGFIEAEVIGILAALENKSEHPIAQAVVNYAKEENITIKTVVDFENNKGKGVTGVIDSVQYFAGNVRLIEDLGILFDRAEIDRAAAEGKTPVIVATKKQVVGVVTVADAIKPHVTEEITALRSMGLKVVMVTGDNQHTAHYIANQVGIEHVVAEVLPHDKMEQVKHFQANGEIVAMVGDGINDAPALAQADVGIAMATGTDVAIDSAGIVLLGGDVSKVSQAIHLSRVTMRGIKQNLFWAFVYNVVGIPVASGIFFPLFGWLLSPVFAGAAMAFSSVSVVLNSLRLKNVKL